MKTKKKATKRWWEPAPRTGGDPVRDLKAVYERISARGYLKVECVCTQERYFIVKRTMREAGLDIPIRIARCSQKQPKFTYKTIRRDCAKRNR